jgi:hypothetical protein
MCLKNFMKNSVPWKMLLWCNQLKNMFLICTVCLLFLRCLCTQCHSHCQSIWTLFSSMAQCYGLTDFQESRNCFIVITFNLYVKEITNWTPSWAASWTLVVNSIVVCCSKAWPTEPCLWCITQSIKLNHTCCHGFSPLSLHTTLSAL